MATCKRCGAALRVHLIERHDPHAESVYIPPNNPNYPEFPNGTKMTYLEEIRFYRDVRKMPRMFRNDIALVNITQDGRGVSLCVYPSITGKPYGDLWELLDEKERAWCVEENARMLETLRQYPEWSCFFDSDEPPRAGG